MSNSPGIIFYDDGFTVTAAEPWIKDKVNIVQEYLTAFVTGLTGRVNDIIIVDLFSGSGLYSLGAQRELFPGTALMALGMDLPVTKFVFCEKDPGQSKILKIRVNKYFRGKNVVLLEGRPEELLDKFRMYVPQSQGDYTVGILCICDPFSLDIPFDTLDKLADRGFTFLIPFTLVLNDRINYRHYLSESRDKLKRFLGGYKDVDRLERELESNDQFYKRLVRMYENNMLALGLNTSTSAYKLDSGLMELPSYYMGLFSKPFSTKAIHEEVVASRNIQFSLFENHARSSRQRSIPLSLQKRVNHDESR